MNHVHQLKTPDEQAGHSWNSDAAVPGRAEKSPFRLKRYFSDSRVQEGQQKHLSVANELAEEEDGTGVTPLRRQNKKPKMADAERHLSPIYGRKQKRLRR